MTVKKDNNPFEVEPHTHRAIIGFDNNGVPKVLVPVSGHTHKHVDEDGNEYEHSHEDATSLACGRVY